MKPNDGQVPAQLADLQRRFEHWRSTRTRLGRIPEPLWDSAVRLPSSVAIAFSFLARPRARKGSRLSGGRSNMGRADAYTTRACARASPANNHKRTALPN